MIGLFSKLFSKNKKTAAGETLQKMPETQSGLNEEMVSKSVEMEPKEDTGLPEVFEKSEEGEKEAAEDAPPKTNTDNEKV